MGKFVAAIAVVLFLVVASPGFSAVVYPEHPQQNDPILLDYWSAGYPGGVNGDNDGGPFYAELTTKGEAWKTFCVEADHHVEYFYPHSSFPDPIYSYKVGSVSSDTATLTQNFVTDAAKFLYYWAVTDPAVLGGLYTPGDSVSESAMQLAIWHGVQNPTDPATPLDTPWNPLAPASGGTKLEAEEALAARLFSLAPQSWDYAYCVGVVNPVMTADGSSGQSMLYVAADVPEPTTVIVWSVLGVAGAIALRRRR